jgi:hypothetical protein
MTEFRAPVRLNGKTATGIPVPPEVVADLGGGKAPMVVATINGYTYRTKIGSMGGELLIPVSAEVRAQAGVAAGDEVSVALELDTAPREVVVPADLQQALASDPGARVAFEALSYSNKRRLVLPIDEAKSPETRARRIQRVLEELRGGG